ncbi:hypothetical protein BGX21_011311 [Mortierella sp. AD011]|nr:hypothetical protein BGX20_001196 [Mortierella sp. AD010]KAF9391109.1 hypothetical protein BGX21_011311 [Mortierella sp. AD011]
MLCRTAKFSYTLSILSYISTVLLCIFSTPAFAQTYKPNVKSGSLSVFMDGKAMYVLGGTSGSSQSYSYSTQVFMIDLSIPWNVSSPAYKNLPDAPVGFFQMVSALSSDGQTWFAQNGNTAFFYNFESSKWNTISSTTTGNKTLNSNFGLGAATDPDTGIIYVPNGLVSNGGQYMLKVNPDESIDSAEMSPQISKTPSSTVAWSTAQRSLIYVDESTGDTFSYSPAKGWSQLAVTGTIPPPRSNACFVEAYGGSKMILFGGYNAALQTSINTIHILDMSSLTWTSGPTFSSKGGRMGAACAASGDYFIVWGGQSSTSDVDLVASNATLVYDMKNITWTSSYIAPSPLSPSKSKTRAIAISCAVLGTVILMLIAGYIYYRIRSKKPKVIDYLHPPPAAEYYDKSASSIIASVRGREEFEFRRPGMQHYPANPPTYSMTIATPGYRYS